MKRGLVAGALASAVIVLSLGAVSKPKQSVNYADLGSRIDIIGPLGEPLGRLITIEGKSVPVEEKHTYWEANQTKALFEVASVNGKELKSPVRIDVHSFSFHPVPIPEKHGGVILKGYQTGGFEDIPDEAFKIIQPVTNAEWHFRVDFIAVERIK